LPYMAEKKPCRVWTLVFSAMLAKVSKITSFTF